MRGAAILQASPQGGGLHLCVLGLQVGLASLALAQVVAQLLKHIDR